MTWGKLLNISKNTSSTSRGCGERIKWDDVSEKHAAICKPLWNRWRCYYYSYQQAFTRKIFIDYFLVPDSLLSGSNNRLEIISPIPQWEDSQDKQIVRASDLQGLDLPMSRSNGRRCVRKRGKRCGGDPEGDSAVCWQTQRGRASQAERTQAQAGGEHRKSILPSASLC